MSSGASCPFVVFPSAGHGPSVGIASAGPLRVPIIDGSAAGNGGEQCIGQAGQSAVEYIHITSATDARNRDIGRGILPNGPNARPPDIIPGARTPGSSGLGVVIAIYSAVIGYVGKPSGHAGVKITGVARTDVDEGFDGHSGVGGVSDDVRAPIVDPFRVSGSADHTRKNLHIQHRHQGLAVGQDVTARFRPKIGRLRRRGV